MRSEGRRMGVSFKVSKTGTRFRPRLVPHPETTSDTSFSKVGIDNSSDRSKPEDHVSERMEESSGLTVFADHEVSFTLNLFPDGFSIGTLNEPQAFHEEAPKSLHPYSRASESLFSAIETAWLPGDILDDIPSKFINGSLICEVG